MKNTNPTYTDISGANWRLLGNFDPSARADVAFAIDTWLKELLGTLDLSTDFLTECGYLCRILSHAPCPRMLYRYSGTSIYLYLCRLDLPGCERGCHLVTHLFAT